MPEIKDLMGKFSFLLPKNKGRILTAPKDALVEKFTFLEVDILGCLPFWMT